MGKKDGSNKSEASTTTAELPEATSTAAAADSNPARMLDDAGLPTLREITTHHVNDCNRALRLGAHEDSLGAGGAPRSYEVTPTDAPTQGVESMHLNFHEGPVADGVNGITHELLLAVLIDRLERFQEGPFAHEANASALRKLRSALGALESRTAERQARGVEGTHEV
jgi:hypothetical protein